MDSARARFAPIAQIKDEARIAHYFAAEASRRNLAVPQKFLDLSQKMHWMSPQSNCDSAIGPFQRVSYLSGDYPMIKTF